MKKRIQKENSVFLLKICVIINPCDISVWTGFRVQWNGWKL